MKKFDPFYWLLTWVLRRFLNVGLKNEELEFLQDNIRKHRKVLWCNVTVVACTVIGLQHYEGEIIGLITALLAPVMVMGGAWFAVSFGGIPAKLIDSAMSITFWMFLAFTASLTTMLIAVGYISPPVLWPVFAAIYLGALLSCIQYDTADGLKAGLDEAQLRHSRAALRYYKKQGIEPEEG